LLTYSRKSGCTFNTLLGNNFSSISSFTTHRFKH
jgi:hypothetical protein